MVDDRIQLNLVLNEATVSAVEGRVRNLVNRLNNTNISLNIDARNLNNIENQFNRIQQQMQTINATPVNINANLTSAQQQYRLETERMRVSQQLELSRQRTLQTENQAISALAQQNRTLNINNNVTHQIEQGAHNIGHNMNVAGGHARDFVDYLADGVRYIVVYRSLYEVMNQIGEAFSEMKNVDKELISVRKTTGMVESEIERIRKASYGVATEYGRTASEYLGSVSEFARGGYKELSTELAKVSLLTQNVGDVSADSANKMLLSVDAAYKLNGNVTELTNVVNGLNNIANLNPASMQKMADGMQVSASMAKVAGLEISDLVALIGTGTAVTQREGGEIARAIRTVLMNIRAQKGQLEDGTIIDDESIAKAEAALKGVGIATKEVVNGVRELRDPMDILDELAGKWHTLNTEAQSVVLESLANKRQANVLAAILENYEMVGKMQSEYFNSANSAVKENELYLQGWEATQKRVSAKWTEFIANMADTAVITGSLNALYGVLVALDTPIGRIATSIVLVNTALAVSGRLWQAIRARSIVADILSMGVAERNLGTAIQLVSGHLGRQIAQWAMSPFGMATIAVAGITLITSAIEKNSQKLEENAQKAGEAYDKVKQNMNELDDLIKQYNDLQISNEWDNTPVETKKQLHEDINRLLGDEADKVDILNGKYKETTEELFKQRMSKLPEEGKKAFDNEQAKGKSLWDTVWWNNGIRTSYTSVLSDEEEKVLDKYSHIFTSDYTTANGEEVHNYQLKFDNLQDFLYKYNEVKNLLQDMYNEGLGKTETYKELNNYISQFETKFNDYETAVEELKNSKISSKLADYINTSVGGYVDDLNEYKIVVDWIKSNFTGKDADNALGLLNSYFSEYAEKVSKTNEMLGREGLSIQLEHLKNASSGISHLSKAFKELNDDGYITTGTLSSIKEAVGSSVSNWDEYEKKLLNAKTGSAEFNQIMSDLTYAILENTFAEAGLANATEEQIAAVLRENGVLNAEAMALEYSRRLKLSNIVASEDLKSATDDNSNGISDNIESLIEQCTQLGLTESQMYSLIAAEIAFNNNELSTDEKIKKLYEIAAAAGIASEAYNSIGSSSSWEEKKAWVGKTEGMEYISAEEASEKYGGTWTGAVYIYNGTPYDDFSDARLSYEADSIQKKIAEKMGDPEFINPQISGGTSPTNKALDDYLKQLEKTQSIYKKEISSIDDLEDSYNGLKNYINGLQYAYDNLAKTEEERADILERMAQAREDYVANEMSAIDDIQSAYDTLQKALQEKEEHGAISVDTLQSLLQLEPQYISMLIDENGNLTLNEQAIQSCTAAYLDQLGAKTALSLIDAVSSLSSEAEQLDLLAGQAASATASIWALVDAQLALAESSLSADVVGALSEHIDAIKEMTESAKTGLGSGGLNGFSGGGGGGGGGGGDSAEDEHLEQLKRDLERRKDLIDRYKKYIDTLDFGLDIIEENDFKNKSNLLVDKLSQLQNYGKAMRAEFDRVADIIPQTGEEAEELAGRLEELGSDMRDNVSVIRETQVALQQLSIDMIAAVADTHLGQLKSSIESLDRRIEILKSDYRDDYQYTNQILSTRALLPTYSDFDKKLREKQLLDEELIEQEQKTQDKINEIVTRSLEMQSEENAKATEKNCENLISGMTQVQQNAQGILADTQGDYLSFLDDNEDAMDKSVQNITKTVANADLELPEIDLTSVDKAIEDINKKLKNGINPVGLNVGVTVNPADANTSAEPNNSNMGGGIKPTNVGDIVVPGYTRISSEYGWRTDPIDGTEKFHSGTDLPAPKGTPIYSYASGTVIFSGKNGSYGNCVIVDHGDGRQTLYAHASELTVKKGDTVGGGQEIAKVGSTGRSTGNHLHFEARKDGEAVSPEELFPTYATGTAGGNSMSNHIGIAGENYKPEILIDRDTGETTYIDEPTAIDTSKMDVIGEKQTARLPKFATGTIKLPSIFNKTPVHQIYDESEESVKQEITLEIDVESDEKQDGTNTEEDVFAKIDGYYGDVTGEISKLYRDVLLKSNNIESDLGLSDFDKTQALYNTKYEYYNNAKDVAKGIYDKLNTYFMEWLSDESKWSQETFEYFTDTLSDIEEAIFEYEDAAVKSIQQKADDSWENSSNWIEDRNFWNDWKSFDDSEIEAWKRVVKWLKEDYPKELDKIEEAEKNLFDARKEEFNKANDYASTYLESQKTILQSHFDITNSIAEAQHEINKELETSKTMYEWLDEETRKLLFNQEDYNTLSRELLRIEDKTLKLQKQYEIDLKNSTLETIESITSEYQMQYETLMKSYEIAKADLEIAKKKQKLNNVLNERNVRMFINGQWQWVANTEDVINAKSELADAEYAKRVEESGLAQQQSINNLTRQQDELTIIIKKFENGVIDLTSAIAMAKNAIGNMPSSLSSMYSNSLPSSASQANTNKSSSGSSVKSSSSSTPKDNATATMPGIGKIGVHIDDSGSVTQKGLPVGTVVHTDGGDYKIVSAGTEGAKENPTSGYWSIRIDEEHAEGTRYTPGGMTLMGEDGFETYINSNGHLIPINQPTIGNIASGGIVFNTDQMKNLRTLWDMSNLNMIPNYSDLIANNKTQNTVTNNDYSVTIKDLVIDNSADGQQLISALRRYIGNH